MECIVGSTLSNNETNIKTYNDISVIINKIKENNVVAKYVRAYILQVSLPKFPSVIGSDKTETILDIHKLLLDFAQELKLHIISIGSDGAQVEFNAQTQLQQISTPTYNLAEYLGMLIPDVIPINSLWPYVLITSNDIEVSGSNDENIQNDKNLNENLSNSNYSQIISCAANEVDLLRQRENKRDEIDINEENKNLDECKKQLFFINMREKRNTYTSRNIKRTAKTNSTRTINLTSINPNQASHIVSLFTKNTNAEIEQDYIIAYYGTQLCIGQVISSFYEAYGYHSYNQEPITDIENISYLTLKVFTPIHNIFSAEVEGGHVLITHQCPKNILYYLDTQDIQIFDNTF
ncbi:21012_t:CDS:2 [Gigaspora margarita]|uniref:21012_t:CDS:1 n=1 Tax=Gigaspora margarita TaxID=4874 RepID=A0ABM8VY51_GIGMA|nr:21012_t:CDS:2 [Gigaspora margarita]